MNLNELALSTREWAHDRNLVNGTTSDKQFIKLVEEIGELAETIAKQRPEEFKAELGDCLVVLTILAEQNDTSLQECFEIAWRKIKDRRGEMRGGYYVKDEDL